MFYICDPDFEGLEKKRSFRYIRLGQHTQRPKGKEGMVHLKYKEWPIWYTRHDRFRIQANNTTHAKQPENPPPSVPSCVIQYSVALGKNSPVVNLAYESSRSPWPESGGCSRVARPLWFISHISIVDHLAEEYFNFWEEDRYRKKHFVCRYYNQNVSLINTLK